MSASSLFSCDSRVLSDLFSASQNTACDPSDVPALAGTLVQLELLLSGAQAVDLESVARLVRADVGLMLQVYRLSREDSGEGAPWRVSDCVSQLGYELVGLVRPMGLQLEYPEHLYSGVRGFWKHSQLVATVAQIVAMQLGDLDVDPEQAYIAGLLHNIDELPGLLTSAELHASTKSAWTTQDWVAKFNLPEFVKDVIDASRAELSPSDLTPICRIVSFAQCWVELSLDMAGAELSGEPFFPSPLSAYKKLVSEIFPELSQESTEALLQLQANASLNDSLFHLAAEFAANLEHSKVSASRVVMLQ